MLLSWTAAHGQLKLNESNQELFFISLGLMVARKLLPVCGCLYASGRSRWIMRFQTVSLQFSERGIYSRGTELVCSLRVAELFFSILCKHTVQNHSLQYPVALLFTFAFSWFVPPIVKVIIFPHEFWQFSRVVLLHFQSDRFLFCLERYRMSFSTFS